MKVDIVTGDDIKIYYTGKFQDFTARYIIIVNLYNNFFFSKATTTTTTTKMNPKIDCSSGLKEAYVFSDASTLSKTTNFRLYLTIEFEDDNFKFGENDRKFSKRVENTERKGEIAHFEEFLLFPQCFQKTCIADT